MFSRACVLCNALGEISLSERHNMNWKMPEQNVPIVVNTANTSNVLQSGNMCPNNSSKSEIWKLRDEFLRQEKVYTTKVIYNLVYATYVYDSIKTSPVTNPFQVTGIKPYDCSFLEQFKSRDKSACNKEEARKRRLLTAGEARRLPAAQLRYADEDTYKELSIIMNGK